MAAESTRIVSLTITEGGYNLSDITGEFDLTNPDVTADLDPGAVPRTAFGLITEALRRRWKRGLRPFTVMSCDNLQDNGYLSKRVFTAFARLRDPELGDWVEREARFPNSMVDRITPVTTDADRAEVRERFGIEDRWPVVCEPYTQWVLAGRLHGRAAAVRAGRSSGRRPRGAVRADEAAAAQRQPPGHGLLRLPVRLPAGARGRSGSPVPGFLLGYMDKEATPTLAPVPGVDLEGYKYTLLERFSNPQVRDTIARLCAESSDRIPKWLLPVVREQLANGGEIRRSAAVVASWARYAEGIDEAGQPIEVVDRLRDTLMRAARRQREDPDAFIANRDVFGDLVDQQALRLRLPVRAGLAAPARRPGDAGVAGAIDTGRDPGVPLEPSRWFQAHRQAGERSSPDHGDSCR